MVSSTELRFRGVAPANGVSTDGAVTATLVDATPDPAAAGTLTDWGSLDSPLALEPTSSVTVPVDLHGPSVTVALAWMPDAPAAESVLVGGPGLPFSVHELPDAAGVRLAVTTQTSRGPLAMVTDSALPLRAWVSVAVVSTGDEVALLVGGSVVVRRPLHDATVAATAGGVVVGGGDGTLGGAAGHLGALRITDGVEPGLEDALTAARAAGLGEIDARWEQLGAAGGWVGAPTSTERSATGGARVRDFAGATITWSVGAGAHEVHGAIRDRWQAAGGADGFLGVAVTDEVDAVAYCRTASAATPLHLQMLTKAALLADTPLSAVTAAPATTAAALATPKVAALGATTVASVGVAERVADALALTATDLSPAVSVAADTTRRLTPFDRSDVVGVVNPGVVATLPRLSRFVGGTIVWSPTEGAHEVHGDIVLHWLLLGGAAGFLGLPITDEEDSGGGGRRSVFEAGTVYWSAATGAYEVHGAIRAHYESLGGPGGLLGFPVTDEVDVRDGNGHPTGGRLNRFEHGTVYWSPASGAYEVHGAIRDLYEREGGPLGPVGYPTTDESGVGGTDIRYNDFQHGVVVWQPSMGAQRIVTLTVKLDRADAPSIDDGVEFDPFPSADHDAEMYTFVTVRKDGVAVPGWDSRRTPDTGHAGKTIEFDHTEIPLGEIHSSTRVQLSFRARDWDQLTSDDDLGSFDADYGIESWWGTLDNGGIHADVGHGGDGDVTYSYSIGRPSEGDPGRAAMRERGWWPFDNFSSPRLDYDMYAETFLDVEDHTSVWDTVTNPLDSLFYELAYKGVASTGNCFGMSQEGRRALHGHSAFREPLSQYTLPTGWSTADESQVLPVWRHYLNRSHGEQLGSAAVGWFISRLCDLTAVQPLRVFDNVCRLIDGGDHPVVSMMSLAGFVGHAVLAYDYQVGTGGAPNVVYVCDPNHPFAQNSDRTSSRIEIHADDSFQFFDNGLPHAKFHSGSTAAGLLPTGLMVEVPSCVLDQPVRTPIWDIVLGLGAVVGGLLILGGDTASTQVTVDGTPYYGAAPDIGPLRSHLDDVVANGVLLKDAVSATPTAPTGFTAVHGAVTEALAARRLGPDSGLTVSSDASRLIDRGVDLGVLAGALFPQVRPGRIAGFSRVPLLDVTNPPEVYARRGDGFDDVALEWRASATGTQQVLMRTATVSVAVGGGVNADETGATAVARMRSGRPLLELSSSQPTTSVEAQIAVQRDGFGRPPRQLVATLPVGAGTPTRFGPEQSGAGIVATPGVAGPMALRVETLADGERRAIGIPVPALEATQSVVVRPSDPASPMGEQVIERSAASGAIIDRTVVTPTT